MRRQTSGEPSATAASVWITFTTILLGCTAVSSWVGAPWTDFVSAAFLLGCAVTNGVAGFQVWRVRQALRTQQTSGEG